MNSTMRKLTSDKKLTDLPRAESLEPNDLILCTVFRNGKEESVAATITQVADAVSKLLIK